MKRNRLGQRGFTLVEIIFVLAIILTLVAIFLPLATSKLSEANETKAQADQDALAAAMTAFFSDLRIWPASDGSTNNNQSLRVLLVGEGGATITSQNPNVVGADWPTAGVCPRALESNVVPTGSCATIANAFNHLVINNPNANGTEDSTADGDYRSSTSGSRRRWKGPYVAKIGGDPFGSNYVINIGAVTGTGTGVGALERGWILSAGPNGDLNTGATDTSPSSDDIGFIFCTRCQ